MDPTTLKMAMAGFFHDIGKFADNLTMGVSSKYFENNADIYLPSWKGRFSHHHALYSAAFIEQMADYLPPELGSREWGEGDSFINLAACHHKPETPLQQIITEADWLASGLERDEFNGEGAEGIAYKDYKKTRLLPLFEQLGRTDIGLEEDFKFCYPLSPLSPKNIFPARKGSVIRSDEDSEYRQLFDKFVEMLPHLHHRKQNVMLWFEHFDSLMLFFTSAIPAARAGKVIHDVSLYDHLRLTSAFSSALYLYHKNTSTLDRESIIDRETEKFLIISGNFYGIQDFIFGGYGESGKHRSKILRGRSFYVSLLTELAAELLCRNLKLTFTSILLNAAGRFIILAPNLDTCQEVLRKSTKEINDWLRRIAYGEITIGISVTPASGNHFQPGSFWQLWERIVSDAERRKFSRINLEEYGGPISDYLKQFDGIEGSPVCPICGKRPKILKGKSDGILREIEGACTICRDHILIGTQLASKNNVVGVIENSSSQEAGNVLLEPIFGRFKIVFAANVNKLDSLKEDLLKCWDISLVKDEGDFNGITKKIINSYVPVYKDADLKDDRLSEKTKGKDMDGGEIIEPGQPMTFNHIAAKAQFVNSQGQISGTPALGILKADIDYLGMLLACGLEKRRHTISRIATLSRQVNYFFAVYIPHILQSDERFHSIYTIFSGGDDLFLVGPWNRIYEFSLVIRNKFHQYVCERDNITFSAGISVHKPTTPVALFAAYAEEAIEESKNAGRNRITIFFETVKWAEAEMLDNVRTQLESWLDKGWITKAMLYRLNSFINMVAMAKEIVKGKAVGLEGLSCLKWGALLYYSGRRNLAKEIKDKREREKILEEMLSQLATWLEEYGSGLRIPLWHVLYNHR